MANNFAAATARRPSRVRDRRSAPRIDVLGQLLGSLESLDAPVEVLNISLSGTLVRTAVRIRLGSVQEFRLTLGSSSAVLRARARRSRLTMAPDGTLCYETGFEFLDSAPALPAPDLEAVIKRLG